MITRLRRLLKRIPGMRSLVAGIRGTVRWLRFRAILPSLYPIATDRTLIRFGPEGDGGYLIPDDLDGIQACFSPGVSVTSGFELDCAKRGMDVFMADGSVDHPADQHPLFHFRKTFLGGRTREGFVSLADWLTGSVGDECGDLMMQMDIEGYEYEVINQTPRETLSRFRVIVVEFHNLCFFDRKKFRALKKIVETHSCLHIHPNNCCGTTQIRTLTIPTVMEFTFLRKDRVGRFDFETKFPHPLDRDNTSRPTMRLPECWYQP